MIHKFLWPSTIVGWRKPTFQSSFLTGPESFPIFSRYVFRVTRYLEKVLGNWAELVQCPRTGQFRRWSIQDCRWQWVWRQHELAWCLSHRWMFLSILCLRKCLKKEFQSVWWSTAQGQRRPAIVLSVRFTWPLACNNGQQLSNVYRLGIYRVNQAALRRLGVHYRWTDASGRRTGWLSGQGKWSQKKCLLYIWWESPLFISFTCQ